MEAEVQKEAMLEVEVEVQAGGEGTCPLPDAFDLAGSSCARAA